jgi:hypothetical protein
MAILLAATGGLAQSAAATVITQWNFPAAVTAPDNSPAPTTGTGLATPLGMSNSYTFTTSPVTVGSVPDCDVLSSATPKGSPNGTFSENTWRIRGPATNNGTGTGNGWALAAPQYTQGAEFDASTVGYTDVGFSFDWYSTNQGVRDLQEQYTLDGSTWNNINALQIATPNDYNLAVTIDFSSIAGASDNPDFGVRLVSAYDPDYTGAGAPSYTSATLGAGGVPAPYNNNSGNWRFGDITFSGTAVPEPASAAIVTLMGFGLLTRRRAGVR